MYDTFSEDTIHNLALSTAEDHKNPASPQSFLHLDPVMASRPCGYDGGGN